MAVIVSSPKAILTLVSALNLAGTSLFGHGDVHDRINLLTAQIAQTPTNASLFFQRAELYRVDQDYTNALADLERVARYDPSIVRVEFCRGRALLEAGRPQEALAPLNKYLAGKPKDVEAFTTRARVLTKVGNYKAATADYNEAIAQSTGGSPELYIERAEAFRAMGKPEEAVRGLDEGIRKMGPLVTLELPAIDLEVSSKRYDAALARIDRVSARLQRKETWLVRRAEILKKAGREEEAKKNYREALAAIDRLPAGHRGTRAMLELGERIRVALGTNGPAAAKNTSGAH
jgi:tetratricopeptide (TPR) repeat protein